MTSKKPLNFMGIDRVSLRQLFARLEVKGYHADQVIKWIHQQGVTEFESMTNLSKTLRKALTGFACISVPSVTGDQTSADGTRKWLLRLSDGNCIEMVFIPEPERGTLCVSSQVGCSLNCTFCATASHGYNRNLTSAEILGQIWLGHQMLKGPGREQRAITNVVMMGMGEPLLNLRNVACAAGVLLDDFGYGLSRRRVTLSTAGMVPQIDELRELCPVSLAVSLHAPNNQLRSRLVPLNRRYPIEQLIDACRRYITHEPRSRVTFQYVMLAGVNDSVAHATELAQLLRRIPSKVNLIPFNAYPGLEYESSDQDAIDRFRDCLLAEGIMTITRKTRGSDIDAACGQLAGRFTDRTHRSARWGRRRVACTA